jgi:hypothetical protein
MACGIQACRPDQGKLSSRVSLAGGNGPWDDDLHAIEKVYLANRGEFLIGVVEGEVVAMGAFAAQVRVAAGSSMSAPGEN